MGTKSFKNYEDLLTFSRASTGYALRPVSYGSELVTNGGFDTASDWTLKPGVSIGSGVLSSDGTTNGELARQVNIGLVSGKLYEVSFDVTSLTTGKFGVKLGGTSSISFDGTGTKKAYFVATSLDNVQLNSVSNAPDRDWETNFI